MPQQNVRLDDRQAKFVDEFGRRRGHRGNRSRAIRALIDEAASPRSLGVADVFDIACYVMATLSAGGVSGSESGRVIGKILDGHKVLAEQGQVQIVSESSSDGIGSDGELARFGPLGKRELLIEWPPQVRPNTDAPSTED